MDNVPTLTKRRDLPKTVALTEMHAISFCEELFSTRWAELHKALVQEHDSGIGQSEGDYFARFDFEFNRSTCTSIPVSVLIHYDYAFGRDEGPRFVEAEFYVRGELVGIRRSNPRSLWGEGPDDIYYVSPIALERAAFHMNSVADHLQVFDWVSGERLYAYHRRCTMILDIPESQIEKIGNRLQTLEEAGICFTLSTVGVPKGFVRFVAVRQHNWNCVWRDTITTLNNWLGVNAREYDVEESDKGLHQDYTVADWLTDCAIEAGVMFTCPDCGETYWSEDGHPEGTLCPKYGIDAQKKPVKDEPGKIECKIHPGTFYWYEDICPKCEA